MATNGDIFRSYYPDGSGRDVHLFISRSGSHPQTSVAFDSERAPVTSSMKPSLRTTAPPRFSPNGSGRDLFNVRNHIFVICVFTSKLQFNFRARLVL